MDRNRLPLARFLCGRQASAD